MRRSVVLVLAVLTVSCGGPSGGEPHGGAARIPLASPVAMADTPRSLLLVCLANALLHRICPRLGPRANQPHTSIRRLGFCSDRAGRDLLLNGHYARLASSRCVQAGWGYEAAGMLPGYTAGGARLSAWNGQRWIALAGESLLFSPPVHVHVEIQASYGSLPAEGAGWPTGARAVSDALLNPTRTRAVSLGWVHWYGQHGQLVLEPAFPSGGAWGGHLVFRFTSGRVDYAISLHAWMPALRIMSSGGTRVIRFQPGPALPHVVATLNAIVGSALKR